MIITYFLTKGFTRNFLFLKQNLFNQHIISGKTLGSKYRLFQ